MSNIGRLSLAQEVADRDAETRQDPAALDAARASENARFILVRGDALAVDGTDVVKISRPSFTAPDAYLGAYEGLYYFALDLTEALTDDEWTPELAELTFVGLRDIADELPALDVGLATTAVALFAWRHSVQFCGTCGGKLSLRFTGWEMECEAGHILFPRTDPAVIMAIRDGQDRLLMGRNRSWPENSCSTLAGFVEAGEPLEATVRREVYEEVGIKVGRVEYFGSQPWPFPRSLMLAFRGWTVEENPEIQVDGVEMAEAFFLSRAELRERIEARNIILPGASSVARALIEDWYGEEIHGVPKRS